MAGIRKGGWGRRDDGPRKPVDINGVPPHDLEAERAFLGSIMLDPTIAPAASRALPPSHFYSPTHRDIFEAMKVMVSENMVIDVTMLVSRLRFTNVLKDGALTLTEMVEALPIAANWRWYVQRISGTYKLRTVIQHTMEVLKDAWDDTEPADTIVNRTVETLLSQAAKIRQQTDLADVQQFTETFNDLEQRARFPEKHKPISSGWKDLDKTIGGWFAPDLIVFAARPSMGKTAAIAQTAMYAASHGDPVLFVSLEMPRNDVEGRVICSASGISHHMARQGKISLTDLELMRQTAADLEKVKIFFDDRVDQTVAAIAAGARIAQQRLGSCAMIVVDYLQLVEPDDRRLLREQQVSNIAKDLKSLAKELKIPVIAAAQLNRGNDKEKDRRPRLSDLRESGGIEAHADVVILLHRDEYYHPGDNALRGKADFIVAKQRMGPVGSVQMRWDGRIGQFYDMSFRTGPGDDSHEEQETMFDVSDLPT